MDRSPAVLVTGSSSGIGRASALALARAGLPTWASARHPEKLADLAAAGCRTLRLDVTDDASMVAAVRSVESEHGAVGALVNNAGYTQIGALEDLRPEALRRQFDTNVFGPARLCQLVLPGMRAQHAGTIVNVGSAAGLVTPPASGAYSMSKYAIEALSDALRLEVAPFGIRVVLVEPGAVRTDFIDTGRAKIPEGGTGAYDAFVRNVVAMTERAHRPGARGVLAADDVATAIVDAVTSRRPPTRYRLGAQARIMPKLRRATGDRLWDRLMLRMAPFADGA
ncbi:short-subunit dehydrogenase [Haloactinopolyspora alba]|uniref:Short-subunit dehydrogenase n=1 Tax=Haloactinopolyspora alba TaxID=648780 RepID=A0A2P8E1F1_9ACTN|nr:SDR family NAD(P)-dependent oxidoreductase [Haloactinopolyspora alba]PSL03269.1 short-subunit dehydrogenase [Haloactinopolyspora alba]